MKHSFDGEVRGRGILDSRWRHFIGGRSLTDKGEQIKNKKQDGEWVDMDSVRFEEGIVICDMRISPIREGSLGIVVRWGMWRLQILWKIGHVIVLRPCRNHGSILVLSKLPESKLVCIFFGEVRRDDVRSKQCVADSVDKFWSTQVDASVLEIEIVSKYSRSHLLVNSSVWSSSSYWSGGSCLWFDINSWISSTA